MTTAKDAEPSALIQAVREELKKEDAIKPPVWSAFVKTSSARERPPEKRDWWYDRSASVLRKVYVLGPIGVQRLRNLYGGRKNHTHRPEHFRTGGGAIIRKVMQQLEKAGYVQNAEKKGKIVTPKGKKFLDGVASRIIKEQPMQNPG